MKGSRPAIRPPACVALLVLLAAIATRAPAQQATIRIETGADGTGTVVGSIDAITSTEGTVAQTYNASGRFGGDLAGMLVGEAINVFVADCTDGLGLFVVADDGVGGTGWVNWHGDIRFNASARLAVEDDNSEGITDASVGAIIAPEQRRAYRFGYNPSYTDGMAFVISPLVGSTIELLDAVTTGDSRATQFVFHGPGGQMLSMPIPAGGSSIRLTITASSESPAEVPVYEDFEGRVGSGWGTAIFENNPTWGGLLGRYAARGATTLRLTTTPGEALVIEFDLFLVDSWDNERFIVEANGRTLLDHQRHTWQTNDPINGLAPIADGGHHGIGSPNSRWPDGIWRRVTLRHTPDSSRTMLRLRSTLNSDVEDESWAIDNLVIRREIEPWPDRDLAARWAFDETSGNAIDAVGNRDASVPADTTRGLVGVDGGAIRIDAGGTGVQVPLWPGLDLTAGWTAAGWFRIPGRETTDGQILVVGGHASLAVEDFTTNVGGVPTRSTTLLAQAGPGGPTLSAAAPPTPEGWHHYALRVDRDRDRFDLYLNGVLAATRSGLTAPPAGSGTLTIGGGGVSPGAELWVDELRIFDRPLNEAELRMLATRTLPLADAGVALGLVHDPGADANDAAGLHWHDFDGDAIPDLFVTGDEPAVLVWDAADEAYRLTHTAASDPGPAAILDADADGRLDIVTADRRLLHNIGAGRFTDVGTAGFSGPSTIQGLIAADVTGDGRPDLGALARNGNFLAVNTPDPAEEPPVAFIRDTQAEETLDGAGDSGRAGPASSADANGDGIPDVFYHLDGGRLFLSGASAWTVLDGFGIDTDNDDDRVGSAWADFDNDGDADLFIADRSRDAPGTLLRNDGDGVFSDVTADAGLGDDLASSVPAWGDIDNDGDLDLVLSTPLGSSIVIFENNLAGSGRATFTRVALGTLDLGGPLETDDVRLVDVDLDGDLDLSFIERGGPVRLFRSGGSVGSGLAVRIAPTTGDTHPAGATIEVRDPSGAIVASRQAGNASGAFGTDPFTMHVGGLDAATRYAIRLRVPEHDRWFATPVVPSEASSIVGEREIGGLVTVRPGGRPRVVRWYETGHDGAVAAALRGQAHREGLLDTETYTEMVLGGTTSYEETIDVIGLTTETLRIVDDAVDSLVGTVTRLLLP